MSRGKHSKEKKSYDASKTEVAEEMAGIALDLQSNRLDERVYRLLELKLAECVITKTVVPVHHNVFDAAIEAICGLCAELDNLGDLVESPGGESVTCFHLLKQENKKLAAAVERITRRRAREKAAHAQLLDHAKELMLELRLAHETVSRLREENWQLKKTVDVVLDALLKKGATQLADEGWAEPIQPLPSKP